MQHGGGTQRKPAFPEGLAFVRPPAPALERVTARLERTEKGVAFAETVEVLEPSPDRRPPRCDRRCGGSLFAHVQYDRQLLLKGEILQDAFRRIGRHPLAAPPPVIGSPEQGYRMRARLHANGARLGFYLEGTHQLCDAAGTGQLLPETTAWIAAAQSALRDHHIAGVIGIEVAENREGTERACHLELRDGTRTEPLAGLAAGLTGLSAHSGDSRAAMIIAGVPSVSDTIRLGGEAEPSLRLTRGARSFFQGNRYLIDSLVERVMTLVPRGPVVDLYAGVGLFGLALAAGRQEHVTLVEGDPIAGEDLERNAQPLSGQVAVARRSVEAYLQSLRQPLPGDVTVIVDPPRTGLSRDAMAALLRVRTPRLVYVSCDPATLARDTRLLIDAGFELDALSGIDLFPNTAHVEAIAAFRR